MREVKIKVCFMCFTQTRQWIGSHRLSSADTPTGLTDILPTLEQEITDTSSTFNKPHIDPLSVDAVIKSQWMVSLSVD